MMYDPIIAKSFSHYDRKRIGCFALILCAFTICSTFAPHFYPLTLIGNAVSLPLSINAVEDMLENTTAPIEAKKMEAICRILEADVDYCEMEGDVRIEPNSSTIYLVTPISNSNTSSWTIQPYPRRGIAHVKNWTVKLVGYSNNNKDDIDHIPKCSQTYNLPAILFSTGGFSGNHFHDFSDLILPLYITSLRFQRDVHFLAADYKPWWTAKFREILDKFTSYEVVDIDNDKRVRCYNKMIAGLNFHRELVINPSLPKSQPGLSMNNFRQVLRNTYALDREHAITLSKGEGKKPRLMIITRKRTRILTNEGDVSRVARELGYDVVLAEAETSSKLSRFAQTVNSCDVLLGIHGAGLTNMVFLPDNAILIQVVPLGAMEWLARLDFGNPAVDMNIKYLEYIIGLTESSLSLKYPIDDPVLKDPLSIHRKGWNALRSAYLDNQNVTIDVDKFKGTLAEALRLLSH